MTEAQRRLWRASEEPLGDGNTVVRTFGVMKRLFNKYQYRRTTERKEVIKEAYTKKAREETQKTLNHAFKVFGIAGAATIVGISAARSLATYIKGKNAGRAYAKVAASLGEEFESVPQQLLLPARNEKLVQDLPDDGGYNKEELLTRLSVDPRATNEILALLSSGVDGDEHKREKEQLDVIIEKVMSAPMDIRDGDMKKYGQPLGPTTTLCLTKRSYNRSPPKSLYCVEGCDNLVRMFTSRADEDKLWHKMWDSFMRDSRLNLDTTNRLRAAHGTVNRAMWIVVHSQPATRPLGDVVTDELKKALPVAADLVKMTQGQVEIDQDTKQYQFNSLAKFFTSVAGAVCIAGLRYGVRGTRALRPVKENF